MIVGVVVGRVVGIVVVVGTVVVVVGDDADDTRPLLSAAALQLIVLTPDTPAAAAAGAPEVWCWAARRGGAGDPGHSRGPGTGVAEYFGSGEQRQRRQIV